jgi:hypothetical protein
MKKCTYIYWAGHGVCVAVQLLLDSSTVPVLEGEQNRFINEIRFAEMT